MMKQWQVARDHVVMMRKTDSKSAEQLNKDIAEKFKKMYSAYEQEGLAAKKQLHRLHQQHVQGEWNQEKRQDMDAYVDEINLDSPGASTLLHYLKHYIRVEEKDRLHTVNHYEHLRDTYPTEAIRIRDTTKEHLRLITRRIEESIAMLQRHPELAKKIESEIAEFREKKFRSIEISSEDVVLKPVELKSETISAPEGYNVVLDGETMETKDSEADSENADNRDYKNIQIDLEENPLVKEINDSPYVANAARDQASIEVARYSNGASQAIQYTAGNIAGIAIGSVAVFIIIVVAVVMLKKRSQRQPITHGFVEVDPAASPEERHVANMQMNGYENPTYRYFEMN